MSSAGADSGGPQTKGAREPVWTDRVDALVQAAADVRMRPWPAEVARDLSDAHRALRAHFIAEMRLAIRGAHAWWEAMIAKELSRAGDRRAAEREVRKRNAVGMVADKRVIAVLRQHWLACEQLNSSLDPVQAVLPEDLLLRSLVGTADEDVAQFLSALPYWPLGIDPDGRWT